MLEYFSATVGNDILSCHDYTAAFNTELTH